MEIEKYSIWNIPKELRSYAEDNSNISSLKHGMFASVPIICKAKDCPYSKVCTIPIDKRISDTRCPLEAGTIVARFDQWCKHFGIDTTEITIKDEDLADVTLIKDLVENEIQIVRAENRIALNADFMSLTLVDIDRNCKAYHELQVSPESTYKLSLLDKKYKILQLLNATRKDKTNQQLADASLGASKNIYEEVQKNIGNISLDID